MNPTPPKKKKNRFVALPIPPRIEDGDCRGLPWQKFANVPGRFLHAGQHALFWAHPTFNCCWGIWKPACHLNAHQAIRRICPLKLAWAARLSGQIDNEILRVLGLAPAALEAWYDSHRFCGRCGQCHAAPR